VFRVPSKFKVDVSIYVPSFLRGSCRFNEFPNFKATPQFKSPPMNKNLKGSKDLIDLKEIPGSRRILFQSRSKVKRNYLISMIPKVIKNPQV